MMLIKCQYNKYCFVYYNFVSLFRLFYTYLNIEETHHALWHAVSYNVRIFFFISKLTGRGCWESWCALWPHRQTGTNWNKDTWRGWRGGLQNVGENNNNKIKMLLHSESGGNLVLKWACIPVKKVRLTGQLLLHVYTQLNEKGFW